MCSTACALAKIAVVVLRVPNPYASPLVPETLSDKSDHGRRWLLFPPLSVGNKCRTLVDSGSVLSAQEKRMTSMGCSANIIRVYK
jgi:hypothetical protein